MTRTQYFTATSADGFIADQDNSLDWLFEVPGSGAPLLPRRITSRRCTLREAHQIGQRVRIAFDVRRDAGQASESADSAK